MPPQFSSSLSFSGAKSRVDKGITAEEEDSAVTSEKFSEPTITLGSLRRNYEGSIFTNIFCTEFFKLRKKLDAQHQYLTLLQIVINSDHVNI